MMSNVQHAEWLSLLDISGPFLSPPVLDRVFPQGLEAADSDHAARLRLAYEEWAEEQREFHSDPAIHDAWIRLVLTEMLGLTSEVLLEGDGIPSDLAFTSPEHGETVCPDFVVFDPEDRPGTRQPRLLISVWPADTELDQPIDDFRWTASPIDRMVALCRSENVGLRLGLVTNGERWALVDAPVGETPAHASWYANLWGPEPLTLRAFRSLVGLRRFFGVAETDRLEAMLVESANYQTEVTDQLGFQVRRAVEVLVQAIDRADADTGRALLADTAPARIYEAALTLMMRLVFLFSAEERGLLRLGDPMYDQFYAVSTLRAQLREAADQVGEEVLERRQDAWSRLLGTFRAIYAGVHHEALQIIPHGSSLFDPDRFPFLEGRPEGTSWRDTESVPLPIDNRTVLLLLESLQLLDLGPGKGARKLSFRALDIEQIGHVYETLLDHSACRATEPMVSLQGNQGREPELPVSKLHELVLQDDDEALVEFLKAELKKGDSPIRKALEKTPEPEIVARLRSACGGDDVLLAQLVPFHDLIRLDPWDDPVVIPEGAVFVTAGEDRRSTGTHYTPRALTEEIVQYALEPVVYRGPAEGKGRDEWELKSPDEILDLKVCDPAMGSGAFLVQACRYLSERLVESWEESGQTSVETSGDLLPIDADERLSLARRLVADRCLYGVDVNQLAVELAKLSIWLITLSSDAPFTFLDHALKHGDSLLGVTSLDQVRHFHPIPTRGHDLHRTLLDPTGVIGATVADALRLRRELESYTVSDIYDVNRKRDLHARAEKETSRIRTVADLVVGADLSTALARATDLDERLVALGEMVRHLLGPAHGENESSLDHSIDLKQRAARDLSGRPAFHWPIEFPEVFSKGGFDAVVMNPPFLGGKLISRSSGASYREYLVRSLGNSVTGNTDLCAFFLLRAFSIVSSDGSVGSLATDSIGQGDTRATGLAQLLDGGAVIHRAWQSRPWPGAARVRIAMLWLTPSRWSGEAILNDNVVGTIDSHLSPGSRVTGEPHRLGSNVNRSFQGVIPLGMGFVVEPTEAQNLLEAEPKLAQVLKPYVSGDDLMSRFDQSASRFIVDFEERTEREAREFAGCWDLVEKRVKPERMMKDGDKYPRMADEWWKLWNSRPALREAIHGLKQVVVMARVSKSLWPSMYRTGVVFSEKVVVFPFDDPAVFGSLASSFHWLWALTHSTFRGMTATYVPKQAFETFPMPRLQDPIRGAAEAILETRSGLMKTVEIGLTELFNVYHDPNASDTGIQLLRELHQELDLAVASSYGWSDLDLEYDFLETRLGTRLTVGPATRVEILDRLLELNHQRHADEPRLGIVQGSPAVRGDGPTEDIGWTLFDQGETD